MLTLAWDMDDQGAAAQGTGVRRQLLFFDLEGVNNPCAVDTGRDGGSLVNRA
ncbi:hypothetical protein [Thioflavicoccus mobilis]|uniref:hypothetical protein n=1 Tax=Thioflavicoccus mobilis TaxID=80679 RepID=UPI0012FA892E|nr:hypothetical protein [Thioflavicoccus mobilis]